MWDPPATCGAVRLMAQVVLAPEPDSVQCAARESVLSLEDRFSVPAGGNGLPLGSSSVTVAVTVSCVAIFTGLMEKLTLVEVCRVFTVSVLLLLLVVCTLVATKVAPMV